MARTPYESDLLFVPAGAEQAQLPVEIGLPPARFFPPATASTSDGLVCVGGRLSPEWLLDAYRHGIFPWPMWDDEPMAWWSLDPRAIIELDGLHISRRLNRTLRSGKFKVTCDREFAGVIEGCSKGVGREDGTWLTPAMIGAYREMHRLSHAHSIEVWLPTKEGANVLVGGIYGIAIGGLFSAESMFHTARDASKVALAHLVAHLRQRGYQLLDIQQGTPHSGRMGAIEISRLEYLRRLAAAIDLPVTFGDRLEGVAVETR
jgi:leucyl/phenylalanyl-tRNA---protein transferase